MSQPSGRCVLVVDDDPDICDILQTVLESYGYTVVTAEGGTEALGKLRAGAQPCVILLDLMMPHMDGAQFRDEQLRDERLATIPVVVLSAGGDVSTKAAALGLEGLTKPVDLDVLLHTITRFCGEAA